MEQPIAELFAANIAFVGSHFALSHPLRAPLVCRMGEKGFLGLYTLVSLAAFTWIVIAFRAAGPGGAMLWYGSGDALWALASLLTVVALVLVIGAGKGNPAAPGAPSDLALREPAGLFRVTRHPMMWGIAVWAAAHILISPTPRTLITAGAMAVLALLGAHLQDRKKEALMGDAWKQWEAKTTFWPLRSALANASPAVLVAAVTVWAGLTWLHGWLGTMPAGIWRWLGN